MDPDRRILAGRVESGRIAAITSRNGPDNAPAVSPDGAVYATDFYEEFIAHGQNYQGQIDPSTGRIYRVRGKVTPLNKDVNVAGKSTGELVALLEHPNRWHRCRCWRG